MKITPSSQEYFSNQNVEIILFPTKKRRKFTNLQVFIDFINKEKEFWDACGAGRCQEIRQHFYNVSRLLEANDLSETDTLRKLHEAIYLAQMNRIPCVFSETKEGKLLKSIFKKSPRQADYAFDYLLKNEITQFNYDSFQGIMYAFNFKDKDKIIEKGVEAEKESLADLSNTYNGQLNELSKGFFTRSEQIKDEFETVKKSLNEEKERFIGETKSLLDKSSQRVSELESLYEEKLRLQSPAKYWHNMCKEYTKKGEKWRCCSIVASVVLIAFLSLILYNAPETLFEQFNFNSLKATIVFALIASIGIYMIRFFVLLSTSAYHLSRDAYERYQLTHIYLSLLNSKAINENERNIVLQSLFSRADTGLLKGDSSPSFPGSVVEQLMKNISK